MQNERNTYCVKCCIREKYFDQEVNTMDRFNEVWAKIMATFQKVIDSIFAIFGMIGGSAE